jgi:hypothetical protein
MRRDASYLRHSFIEEILIWARDPAAYFTVRNKNWTIVISALSQSRVQARRCVPAARDATIQQKLTRFLT